jgi:hypothetical protein
MALAALATLGGAFVFYPVEGDVSMTLAYPVTTATMREPITATVDKPSPIAPMVDALEAVKPESVSPVATAIMPRSMGACAFSGDPGPEVSATAPQKNGKFVYVLSPTDTTLCVVDANKQASTLQLKAGEGRSVYGAAPWQISGSDLTQIQIYFQGWRASLPDGAVQKIVLVEKAIAP